MAKILSAIGILLVLTINLSLSLGLSTNFRTRKFFARQEAAQPTGYPAAGVTPAIPFEETPVTAKPDASYLPPDNTYGPPAAEIPVEEPVVEDEPAPVPSTDDNEVVLAVAKDGTVIAVSTSFDETNKNSRLVNRRFPQARRNQGQPVPARLTNNAQNVAFVPRLIAAPERRSYTVQLQQW